MPVIPETIGPSTEALNLVTWGGYQFAVWYTLAGECRVGRIERGVQRWGVDHDEYEFAGTPRTTLALPRTFDGHNVATIAVDGLGKIHVWANMHANPLRAVATTAAHDTDGWLATAGWTSAASAFPGIDPNQVTYPYPCHLADGSLIFYARDQGGSGASDSRMWKRAVDGTTWTGPTKIFKGMGVPDAKGPGVPGEDYGTSDTEHNWSAYPSGSIYVESPRSPNPGRLHTCWVWRLFALDSERENFLPSYAYSDDGGTTWKAIDGTTLTLPITPLNAVAARFPKHARILSITRASFAVSATLDSTTHGIVAGDSLEVQVASNETFNTGAAGITTVTGADIGTWGQLTADATATFSGYVGRDSYQNGQAVTVDDNGYPHVIHSQEDTWWTRWNGTAWQSSIIANPLHGVTHTGAASCVWHRGNLWMLKGGTTGPAVRRPYLYNITGGAGTVVMGGPVSTTGGHEPSYDPEAYRRHGTVEVLTCDGDTPRVYTFGGATKRKAA